MAPKFMSEKSAAIAAPSNKRRYTGYRDSVSAVSAGVDEDIKCFCTKANTTTILADKSFQEELLERKELADKEIDVYTQLETLDASRIIEIVARVYKVDREGLIKLQARKDVHELS